MSTLNLIFIIIFSIGLIPRAHAQSEPKVEPTVEWYPPETEKSLVPGRSKVVISGRTLGGSLVQIDGESITIINEKGAAVLTNSNDDSSPQELIRQLRVHCKVYTSSDIKSKVLGTFQKGDNIKAIESAQGWLKVLLPKGFGFMSLPCVFPLSDKVRSASPRDQVIESRSTHSNAEGFFEIAVELPQGLAQIPILVTSPKKTSKTFMISANVRIIANNVDEIKMNTKISRSKPPAAGKKVRLWFGAGLTYQGFSQTTMGAPDLKFQTIQSPGVVGRGGYWGDKWGVDFYFRDAPGKIEAEQPLQSQSDSYHWQTIEAKGLYQFDRGPGSRIGGLPSQWQLRFGTQLHQIPFIEIKNTTLVTFQESYLTMATLGAGLLLGQEQEISYEFALGVQYPLFVAGQGKSFSVSSPFGYEAQLGVAYKFAPNWRLGLFSYTQSLSYAYVYQNSSDVQKTGKQELFYTTFDMRLGYEF